jgi:carbon storage regulator CsrA
MLVISRREDESFVLCVRDGEGQRKILVEVSIVAVRGNSVRIGIETTREIEIVRKEIYEEKRGAE